MKEATPMEESLWLYEQGGPIPPTEQDIFKTLAVCFMFACKDK